MDSNVIIFVILLAIAFYFYQNKEEKKTPVKEEIETESEESLFWKYLAKKEYLMTYTEKVFFNQLQEYLKEKDYMIFSKVRLADLVDLKDQYKWEAKKVFNLIRAKHIDFIITDTKGKILTCIELDDYRHEKENRSDQVKNSIMETLGLDFIRFKVWKEYDFSVLSLQNQNIV